MDQPTVNVQGFLSVDARQEPQEVGAAWATQPEE